MFNLSPRPWNPPTDVYESEDSIVIKMEAPGVSKDDLEILLEGNLLMVRGRRRRDPSEKGLTYQLVEIPYGPFERTFELPTQLSLQDIRAEYRDGFLRILVPRRAATPRLVPVVVEEEEEP
jgi:HSP20 family protein